MSLWFKSYTNSLCSILYSSDQIRSQICTCHDSSAVMTRANLWPDPIIIIHVTATCIITIFELWTHQSLWNASQRSVYHTGLTHLLTKSSLINISSPRHLCRWNLIQLNKTKVKHDENVVNHAWNNIFGSCPRLRYIWCTRTLTWDNMIFENNNQGPLLLTDPDSKVHGANKGPTWVLLAPDGPRVGPMNLAIRGD